MTLEKIYLVKGMSCQHCVNAIKQAVSKIEGVQSVAVIRCRAGDGNLHRCRR